MVINDYCGQHGSGGCSVVVPIWKDPWMVVGPDTFAWDLLTQVGARPCRVSANGRYPRVLLEELVALDPDIVLLPNEPYCFLEDDIALLRDAGLHRSAISLIEGSYLFWHNFRMLRSLPLLNELCRTPTTA